MYRPSSNHWRSIYLCSCTFFFHTLLLYSCSTFSMNSDSVADSATDCKQSSHNRCDIIKYSLDHYVHYAASLTVVNACNSLHISSFPCITTHIYQLYETVIMPCNACYSCHILMLLHRILTVSYGTSFSSFSSLCFLFLLPSSLISFLFTSPPPSLTSPSLPHIPSPIFSSTPGCAAALHKSKLVSGVMM